MKTNVPKITVFYDGSCPRCIKDRKDYEEKESGNDKVLWFDITGKEQELLAMGINPYQALTELHIRNADGHILSELDAYQVLLARIPRYRIIGWLIGLPLLKPLLSSLYRWGVKQRLKKAGRL